MEEIILNVIFVLQMVTIPFLIHILLYQRARRRRQNVLFTDEYYLACKKLQQWIDDKAIAATVKNYSNLIDLVDGDLEKLKNICGPHGFAYYKMLVARRKWWHI